MCSNPCLSCFDFFSVFTILSSLSLTICKVDISFKKNTSTILQPCSLTLHMVVILQKGHLELVPFVPQLFSLTVYKVAIFLRRTRGVVQPFLVALCYRSFR